MFHVKREKKHNNRYGQPRIELQRIRGGKIVCRQRFTSEPTPEQVLQFVTQSRHAVRSAEEFPTYLL